MFEKFGFKDVCYNIWKYKFIFIVVELVIVGLILKNYLITPSSEKNLQQQNDQFLTSISYVVENADGTPRKYDNTSEANKLIVSYVALLKTDLCNDYISKKVLEVYKEKDLNEFLVENSENKEKNKNNKFLNSIAKSVKVEQLENSSLINISVESLKKDLGEKIISAYKEFLSENVINEKTGLNLKLLGLNQNSTASEKQTVKVSKTFIIKKLFIYSVLAMTILAVIVCFKVLFYPTLNRKSDFADYNVPVISEIPSRLFKEKN